jgi:hypothetical protein
MNCFDLYTQYANCEGFGLPQVEAAACGVPVCGTDYSAMESVLRKLEGYPIKPKSLYKELETGCYRAVPDNDLAASYFKEFFEDWSEENRVQSGKRTRECFEKYYQWHLSGAKWEMYFDSVEIQPFEKTWGSPANIQSPKEKIKIQQGTSSKQLAKWLIANVLRDPSKLNSYFEFRLTRDLTYQSATHSTGGMYFNESSAAFSGQNTRHPFNFDMAYDQMVGLCNRRNKWEQKRVDMINKKTKE